MTTDQHGMVPFTGETVMKCKCGSCPIHKQSQCIKGVVDNLQQHMEILEKDPLVKEEIPGAYCASGKASCDDLKFENPCVCGTCEVFNQDFHLADDKPGGYYCKGGWAV